MARRLVEILNILRTQKVESQILNKAAVVTRFLGVWYIDTAKPEKGGEGWKSRRGIVNCGTGDEFDQAFT